jgi:Family of unknown function (DUF6941)
MRMFAGRRRTVCAAWLAFAPPCVHNMLVGTAGVINPLGPPLSPSPILPAAEGRANPGWRTSAMSDKPPPVCKAILMCNRAEMDPTTRRFTLEGVFDTLAMEPTPGPTAPFVVFMLLTGSQGEQGVWVEVHDLRDGSLVGRTPAIPVAFPGRADYIFVKIECPPIFLPSPGRYDLLVRCDDGDIDRLSFSAVVIVE